MHDNTRKIGLIKKPFWFFLGVSPGSSSHFRVPTGWVVEDLFISNASGSYISISASTNVDQQEYIEYSADDLTNTGELPFSFNVDGSGSYPSGTILHRWEGIGSAELRSVQIKQSSSGWNTEYISFAGVLIQDPRCFGP